MQPPQGTGAAAWSYFVPGVEHILGGIVFVASEVVHAHQGRSGLTEKAPWIVAFGFGLLMFVAAFWTIGRLAGF
jgi:hypothetical protein